MQYIITHWSPFFRKIVQVHHIIIEYNNDSGGLRRLFQRTPHNEYKTRKAPKHPSAHGRPNGRTRLTGVWP